MNVEVNDRVIALEGVTNLRDYGGYAAAGGARVRRDVLFRSGHHHVATDEDLAAVGALNLRSIIDLRGNGERERQPSLRPDGCKAEVLFFDGETAGLAPHLEAAEGALDEAGAYAAMERLYSRLPFRDNLIWIMRRYFEVLAEGKGASLVHCHAGKDRTGMAVALLHHALGVHPDDAMEDYLLTNEVADLDARVANYRETARRKYGAKDDATIRVLMGVDARFLEAAYKALRDEYGSVDAFLRTVLLVDDERTEALRLHLLER